MKFIDASCPYCGAPVIMDNKGRGLCEYCGRWVIYDDTTHRYVLEDAYKAGYEFEKGRQKAQAEARAQAASTQETYTAPRGRRPWFLWVLGFICIFPLPVTILISRAKSLPKAAKIIIITVAWALYIAYFVAGWINR